MIPPPAPVLHLPILSVIATPSRRGSLRTPVSVAALSPRRKWGLPQLRSSLPPEGAPAELVGEDSKFMPLNAEDPMYGPPALLLIGFEKGETVKIQEFLKELDGDFLKVIHCTEEMTKQTLWDAMQTEQPDVQAIKVWKKPLSRHLFPTARRKFLAR